MDYLQGALDAILDFEKCKETDGSYPSERTLEQLEVAKTYAIIAIAVELRRWRSEDKIRRDQARR